MKKRLLKAMPHVPILELRSELREQNEETDDPDAPQDFFNDTELNTEDTDEANLTEMEATFHGLESKHTGGINGLVQRFKRFISKRKVNRGNIVAGRTGPLVAEDDNMRYGDDEISESDNELEHDRIPIV